MSRNEFGKRRLGLVAAVMSLLLLYTVLMTSVNVSTPYRPRIHDDKQFGDHPTVDLFSFPQLVGQEEQKLNRNQIPIPAVEDIDDSMTIIKTKSPESASSAESIKPNETTNELTTTQLPNNEDDEVTTTQKAIMKVKDYYPSGFSYPNPELCLLDGMGVKLLIIVISAPANFLQRKAIRLTWGTYTQRSDINIAFLIGQVNQPNITASLLKETALYDDIITANFQDSYQNLTLKSMAMLEWTSSYCSKAEYLLKADDDMFINVDNLLQFIDKLDKVDRSRSEPKIYGHLVRAGEPDRRETSKFFLSYEQFSGNTFPDYVTGPAYLFSSTLIAPSFFEKGMEARFNPMEDVFVTGLLAEALNVSRVEVAEFQSFPIQLEMTNDCELSKYISIHRVSYRGQLEIWRRLSDGRTEC
jgi:hypothetical protein